MTKSNSLTAAQLRVLTTAAQRPDRLVLPPERRAGSGGRHKLLATLLKLELVHEIPVDDAAIAWRTAEGDCHLALRLTGAGIAAVGGPEGMSVVVGEGTDTQPAVEPAPAPSDAAAPDPGAEAPTALAPSSPTGKLGQVLEAISAGPGATLAEITALTRWLPHTAKAAVTGLRRRGYPIQLVEEDGRRAYRRVGMS